MWGWDKKVVRKQGDKDERPRRHIRKRAPARASGCRDARRGDLGSSKSGRPLEASQQNLGQVCVRPGEVGVQMCMTVL